VSFGAPPSVFTRSSVAADQQSRKRRMILITAVAVSTSSVAM
jgi:hypothetical protein